jgi:hypothetical protein
MKIIQILPKNIDILDVVKLHTNIQITLKDIKIETEFKVK